MRVSDRLVRPSAGRPGFIDFAKRAMFGGLVKIGGAFLAFVFFIVVARQLTPEQFGLFGTAFSAASVLMYVVLVGQHNGILRFWPALNERDGSTGHAEALRFSLRHIALGTLLTGAIAVLALFMPETRFKHTDVIGILPIACILACMMAWAEFLASALRAKESLVLALVPRDIAWRILSIAAIILVASPTASEAVLLTAAVLAISILPQLWHVWRELEVGGPERSAVSVEGTQSMRHARWGLWAGSLVGVGIDQFGTILVAIFLGPVAAAGYFAADRAARLISVALVGALQIVGPRLARSWQGARYEEVRSIYYGASVISLAAAASFFVVFVVFGHLIIAWFKVGEDAYALLLVLSFAQLVNAACGPGGIFLMMAGKERTFLMIQAFWGIIGIACLIFFTLRFGAIGAAVANFVSLAGWNLHSLFSARTIIGKAITGSAEAKQQSASAVGSGTKIEDKAG